MEKIKGASILQERPQVALAVNADRISGSSGVASIYGSFFKRVIDVLVVLATLPLIAPVFLVLYFLVRRDGGSFLYSHERVGRNGETFGCLKIRTMVTNSEDVLRDLLENDADARAEWDEKFKLADDPRITPVGRVLRSTSFDELPQIFNVLMGDMSLVGPRPITDEELARYGEAAQCYKKARPGLTGPWQVTGRRDNDFKSRVALDCDYVENISFASDMYYLLATVPEVLFCRGR